MKRNDRGLEFREHLLSAEESVSSVIRSVAYWDEYAPWYRLWLEHTGYHHGIKDLLAGIVRPGWRVLDIGGGSGVLAIPLIQSGCRVTVVEPSEVMRGYLRAEMVKAGVEADGIIGSLWEEVPTAEVEGFDFALASNSLHLTRIGTEGSLIRIFAAQPSQVFVVTELEVPFFPNQHAGSAYRVVESGSFPAENSFRYHSVEEAFRHLELKDKHGQDHPLRADFVRSLEFENGHFVHRRWTTVRWLRMKRDGA